MITVIVFKWFWVVFLTVGAFLFLRKAMMEWDATGWAVVAVVCVALVRREGELMDPLVITALVWFLYRSQPTGSRWTP